MFQAHTGRWGVKAPRYRHWELTASGPKLQLQAGGNTQHTHASPSLYFKLVWTSSPIWEALFCRTGFASLFVFCPAHPLLREQVGEWATDREAASLWTQMHLAPGSPLLCRHRARHSTGQHSWISNGRAGQKWNQGGLHQSSFILSSPSLGPTP